MRNATVRWIFEAYIPFDVTAQFQALGVRIHQGCIYGFNSILQSLKVDAAEASMVKCLSQYR